jgi:hypothetical protein
MPKQTLSLPESVRQTAIAAAPLLIVIILFIFVGNFGVSKVMGLRGQIQSAEALQATLTQKLAILQTLSATAASAAPLALGAVPDTNPALSTISQLKILALQEGIVLSGIRSSSGVSSTNGMNEASIVFSADGTLPKILSFLNDTAKVAPIMIVDRIAMTESLGIVRAELGVKSYWAELPKTIPSVDSPVTDLTASEKATLTKVSALTQPIFTQAVPSQGGTNPNPFGQ